MKPETLLYRQINPNWVQGNRVTSQAFRPMPKDKQLLSAYDVDVINAEGSWRHFTSGLGFASIGVCAISVAECAELELQARPDPVPFPEHAVIDFAGLDNKAAEKKSKDSSQSR
jgi:hypothetical protein